MNAKQSTEHISLKEKKIFLQDEINDLLRLEIQIMYMNKASMLRNVKNVKNLCVLKYLKKKKILFSVSLTEVIEVDTSLQCLMI